ncbi:hypothetical protein UlMin_006193 [Ulmus minor]
MAELFNIQAKTYAGIRPTYPPELFQFIASHTPSHNLAWDVGTGSGQAARALSGYYKNIIATDASTKPLEFAPKLPNVRYEHTSIDMSKAEIEKKIAPKSSVDLITAAQALHWFDLKSFYEQAKWVLRKPNGVLAAWCYTEPTINPTVDEVFRPFYTVDSWPFWDATVRKIVDDEYKTFYFPFEPVDGMENTGPFEFVYERLMDLDEYFSYIRSWSAYQTAKEKGFELLRNDVVEKFENAWREDGKEKKIVKFRVHLIIGKVGNI